MPLLHTTLAECSSDNWIVCVISHVTVENDSEIVIILETQLKLPWIVQQVLQHTHHCCHST